ncbi:MAG: GH32 C-terminal domain-containing protein [Eubacteriales bacterium]|nr:GH32 C-terminal domain-containing protein [Eubacteriales bacterium]
MQSYRPSYHASVPSGWSNDPNGTVFYDGKAHLFFQHYPHKPEWGTMHWGHFTTTDFVKWETLPVALVPDQEYEVVCGCCSGSAIEKDGDLWLIYTAAQPERQRQCLAVSKDGGIHFEKNKENPILTSGMLDLEVTETDCRDPHLFRKDDFYYFIAGARVLTKEELKEARALASAGAPAGEPVSAVPAESAPAPVSDQGSAPVSAPASAPVGPSSGSAPAAPVEPSSGSAMGVRPPSAGPAADAKEEEKKAGYGNMILARSRDLFHWEYIGHLLDEETEGQIQLEKDFYVLDGAYECPDYIVLNGQEFVLTSPQNLPQIGTSYQNVHSGVYLLGELNFENGRFRIDKIGELDQGFDFYAAQTLQMPDGRVILIAWKEMWDRNFPTRKEGWAGTYTLPRELSFEDGCFIQKPVREIERYRQGKIEAAPFEVSDDSRSVEGVSGKTIELHVTIEPGTAAQAGVKLFCGSRHETLVYYDAEKEQVIFDRSRSGIPFTGQEDDVDRRVCPVGKMDSIDMRIFLDISTIEVFLNGGRSVMTGNVYPDPDEDTGVQFFSRQGKAAFRNLEKYDIIV